MKKRYGLTLALLFAAAVPGTAATRYVRSGATGSGSGSDWANACTFFTGSCAVSSLTRGDTVYVASGIYSSTVNFNKAESGTTVITIKKATVADHGTSTGWNDTFGSTVASIKGINFGTGYWVFDGQTGGGPSSWKTGFGFYINGTGGGNPASISDDTTGSVTVRHVEIEGDHGDGDCTGCAEANDGFYCGRSNNNLFEYMYIHDTGRTNWFVRCSNTTVRYSWMARNESTAGEHSEGASMWSGTGALLSNWTFAFDVWEDIEGTGVIVYAGDTMSVYGNIFTGIGPAGMGNGVVSTWSADEATNIKVYNCTFSNTGLGVNFPDSSSAGNVAFNNIFYNTNPGFTSVASHDYNWFFGAGGTWGESHAQAGAGDPFQNKASEDFHLVSHTNAGLPQIAPFNVDPDGVVRGVSGAWDRGAFQLGSVTVSVFPPTGLGSFVQ